MISYPVSIPSAADIAEMTIVPRNVVGISESPFTFEQQVFQHQGQRWEINVQTNILPRASANDWRAFLSSLMGAYGTFAMGDPMGGVPRGTAAGSAKVRVDSQTGNELDFYDAETSVNSWLVPGDYIQLGTGGSATLHRVIARPTTNASGAGILDIWPRLRSSPSSGAAIIVRSAVGLWRLIPGSVVETLVTPNNVQLSFAAMEAL